jgi:hypothetical protein
MGRWTEFRREIEPRRLFDAAVVLGLVAGVATMVATVVLTRIYRPHAPDWVPDLHPGHPARATDGWLGAHASASAILGMAAFAFLLLLVWPNGRPAPWRRPAPIVAAVVATVTSAVAILTRDLVGWDQLALTSVTVGDSISGYWVAAFDDRVRFVLVDGQQVGQSTYARSLVVHLVSPVAAVAALVAAWLSVRRLDPAQSSSEPVDPVEPVVAQGGSST